MANTGDNEFLLIANTYNKSKEDDILGYEKWKLEGKEYANPQFGTI